MEANLHTDNSLRITPNAANYLFSVTKWAKFLSIVTFLGCGLMLLSGLAIFFLGALMPNIQQSASTPMIPLRIMSVFYVVMAVLYFFIGYYMNGFANKIANALTLGIENDLEAGFKNLKSQYTLIGVATIVMIALMLVAIAAMVIYAVASAVMM